MDTWIENQRIRLSYWHVKGASLCSNTFSGYSCLNCTGRHYKAQIKSYYHDYISVVISESQNPMAFNNTDVISVCIGFVDDDL